MKAEVIGLALLSVVFGGVLVQITNYYRMFGETDPRAYRYLVGVGAFMTTAQFAVCTVAVLKLIDNMNHFSGYWTMDLKFNMIITLLLLVFRAGAAIYFSRRMWSLTGKRLAVLILLGLAITACTVFGAMTTAYGFNPPPLTTISDVPKLTSWFKRIGWTAKLWAVTCPVIDVMICATTIVLLLKSKTALGGQEKTLLRKVIVLTTETMLPPAMLTIVLVVFFEVNGVLASYDRSIVWVVGPVYYLTILHSLVARQELAAIIYPTESKHRHILPESHQFGSDSFHVATMPVLDKKNISHPTQLAINMMDLDGRHKKRESEIWGTKQAIEDQHASYYEATTQSQSIHKNGHSTASSSDMSWTPTTPEKARDAWLREPPIIERYDESRV